MQEEVILRVKHLERLHIYILIKMTHFKSNKNILHIVYGYLMHAALTIPVLGL